MVTDKGGLLKIFKKKINVHVKNTLPGSIELIIDNDFLGPVKRILIACGCERGSNTSHHIRSMSSSPFKYN